MLHAFQPFSHDSTTLVARLYSTSSYSSIYIYCPNTSTMAGISNSPLHPFRKQEPPKPLHSRWGDVSISVPTEGSWSQYNSPKGRRHTTKRADHSPSNGPPTRSPPHTHHHRTTSDDESTSSAESTSSRRSSFLTNTLNPRRLSTRLTPRAKSSTETHSDDRRTEFAYKPIKKDYPAEVAQNQAGCRVHRADSRSSGFRYIPAASRYRDEFGDVPPRSRSVAGSCRGRVGGDEGRGRSGDVRRLGAVERTSSSKYLTTAMVPDPDEIYE